jgi:endonuclease III
MYVELTSTSACSSSRVLRTLFLQMRTSRISRDTSRILAATRSRRTIRQTSSRTSSTTRASGVDKVEAGAAAKNGVKSVPVTDAQSDSELSSAPDSDSDGEGTITTKKRKRAQPKPVAVKQEAIDVSVATVESPKKGSRPKKARRAPAKKRVSGDGSVKVEPPPNWEEMYALTREMRNENVAPVDTMGCESLADGMANPRDQRFQTLVALMLSSQTKDTVTSVAIKGMQDRMPGVSIFTNASEA